MISNLDALPVPGTIGLTPIAGDVGKLIGFAEWLDTHSEEGWLSHDKDVLPWEHAFILTGTDGSIIEAEVGGARPGNVSEYSEIYWCTNIAKLATADQLAAIAADKKFIGTPYSFLDYFALTAHRLHLWAPGLKGYIGSTNHLICSQLCDAQYMDNGVEIFADKRWPGYVTPLDLYIRDRQLAAGVK